MKKKIAENLRRIKEEIGEACARVRRNPREVRVVAVTKSMEVDTIRLLMDMGQTDIAESRVQELVRRYAMIEESINRRQGLLEESEMRRLRWHMVGHLQRNKVKQITAIVEYLHSVDSLRLAEEINTCAAKLGMSQKSGVQTAQRPCTSMTELPDLLASLNARLTIHLFAPTCMISMVWEISTR